jgi:hypothetical protein
MKTAICQWCGEEITLTFETWRHTKREDEALGRIFCECHCADCDPRNGFTDGRECIDGEPADPDLTTIREAERA